MKRFATHVIIGFFLMLPCADILGQQSLRKIWNAGAVKIQAEYEPGGHGYGQGYLVVRNEAVYVYTISHVIKQADRVKVKLPGVKGYDKSWSRAFDADVFKCEKGDIDDDPGCYFRLRRNLTNEILNNQHQVTPYKRLRDTIVDPRIWTTG